MYVAVWVQLRKGGRQVSGRRQRAQACAGDVLLEAMADANEERRIKKETAERSERLEAPVWQLYVYELSSRPAHDGASVADTGNTLDLKLAHPKLRLKTPSTYEWKQHLERGRFCSRRERLNNTDKSCGEGMRSCTH